METSTKILFGVIAIAAISGIAYGTRKYWMPEKKTSGSTNTSGGKSFGVTDTSGSAQDVNEAERLAVLKMKQGATHATIKNVIGSGFSGFVGNPKLQLQNL